MPGDTRNFSGYHSPLFLHHFRRAALHRRRTLEGIDGTNLLFLCTGNLCRSPMAAALVQRRAFAAGALLTVSSAGFETVGRTPPIETLRVMEKRGIDLHEHRSRTVDPDMLDSSDLIIGMTRTHVWDAAVLAPDALNRAFVFGELVRLNAIAGGRRGGEKFDDWIARLHSERRHGVTRVLNTDEVLDPFGRRQRIHERAARRIEQLIVDLADCAFDPAIPARLERWREGKLIWRA